MRALIIALPVLLAAPLPSNAGPVAAQQAQSAWETCVFKSSFSATSWEAARSEVQAQAREIVAACKEEREDFVRASDEKHAKRLEARLVKYAFKALRQDQQRRQCEDC